MVCLKNSEFSDPRDSEYKDKNLLGYCGVWSRRINRRFICRYCLHHQVDEFISLLALIMEAVSIYETSV
jgi:hypothetical protein